MARIIIVDDDEVVTEFVIEVLSAAGHLVSAVHDGDLALAAIADAGPDLVILDYSLPGRTGLELLRTLRGAAATHVVPVLMLTAQQGRILAGRAVLDGVDAYMTKPFTPATLAGEVERLLSGARSLRTGPLFAAAR